MRYLKWLIAWLTDGYPPPRLTVVKRKVPDSSDYMGWPVKTQSEAGQMIIKALSDPEGWEFRKWNVGAFQISKKGLAVDVYGRAWLENQEPWFVARGQPLFFSTTDEEIQCIAKMVGKVVERIRAKGEQERLEQLRDINFKRYRGG